jgi:hypothetical protein
MLKARLLETHTLSNQEKMDILFKFEPLGGRKLSQMLANMLTYCPSGMAQSIMFQFMFLQHLPVTILTLLGNRSLVTSEAWQPEQTSCGPLTGRSLMS